MPELKRHQWVLGLTGHYLKRIPIHKREAARDYVLAETDTKRFLHQKLCIVLSFWWNAGQWYAEELDLEEEHLLQVTRFNMYAAALLKADRKLERRSPMAQKLSLLIPFGAIGVTSYVLMQTVWSLVLMLSDLFTGNLPLLLLHFALFLLQYVLLNFLIFLLAFHASCLAFGEHTPFIIQLMDRLFPRKNPFEKLTWVDFMLAAMVWLGWKMNEQTINHLSLNRDPQVKQIIRTLSEE